MSLEGHEEELVGVKLEVGSLEPNTSGCDVFKEGVESIVSTKISMSSCTLELVLKGKMDLWNTTSLKIKIELVTKSISLYPL